MASPIAGRPSLIAGTVMPLTRTRSLGRSMVLILTALTCKGAVTGGGGGGGGPPNTDPRRGLDEPTLAQPAPLPPTVPGAVNPKGAPGAREPGAAEPVRGGRGVRG